MYLILEYAISKMAEEKGDKKRGEESVEDGGPGLVYMPFVVNEELLDKLRLLNYETEFIKPLNMKNFSRLLQYLLHQLIKLIALKIIIVLYKCS